MWSRNIVGRKSSIRIYLTVICVIMSPNLLDEALVDLAAVFGIGLRGSEGMMLVWVVACFAIVGG